MAGVIGEYACKLDSKSRLAVPAALLRQLPPDNNRFVVNRGFEKNLVLYPIGEWERTSRRIERLNRYDRESRLFVRNFYRGATELTLDGNNRLLIPKRLLDYAGITDQLVLHGTVREVEIWEPGQFEQELDLPDGEFSRLAQKLLGDAHDADDAGDAAVE